MILCTTLSSNYLKDCYRNVIRKHYPSIRFYILSGWTLPCKSSHESIIIVNMKVVSMFSRIIMGTLENVVKYLYQTSKYAHHIFILPLIDISCRGTLETFWKIGLRISVIFLQPLNFLNTGSVWWQIIIKSRIQHGSCLLVQ